MTKAKVSKQIIEEQPKEEEEEVIEEVPPTKIKKQLTQEQLDNLAKAREKARERKIELAQIASKAKLLKEEQLRKSASEYDKLISEKENQPKETSQPQPEPKIEPKKKRIVKKYVYEDEDEEEVEEVIIRKPKPKSYNELIYESAQDKIKSKINEERTKSLINSLMPVHFR
jgi:hypothetical protein